MKTINDTRSLVIAAGFGAAVFATNFVIGQAILLSTGIPLIGGFASVVPLIFVAVVGAKLVPRFGVFTVMWAIATFLSFPTTSFGPPGLYKIVVGFVLGIVSDVVVAGLRHSRIGYIVACAIAESLGLLLLFWAMLLLGMEIPPKLPKMIPFVSISYAVLAAIGAYLGLVFFERRISKLGQVRSLLNRTGNDSSTNAN